jgi:ABC-2 type transport system permease protein
MRKALLVARWEFLTTIRRRAYIFAVIAMPLFYSGLLFVAGIAGRSASVSVSRIPTAIVDPSGIVDLDLAAREAERRDRDAADSVVPVAVPQSTLVAYADLDRALDDLRTRRVAAIVAIAPDYRTSGAMTLYARDSGLLGQQTERQRIAQAADALRVGLLKSVLPGEMLSRAYAPAAHVTRMRMDGQGTVTAVSDPSGLGPFAGPFGVFLLLAMAIFFSAGFLGQATIEDRQNRMIEILFSSIDPDELVLGKIMGLGGAGLLQVGIYLVLVIVPGATLVQMVHVPLSQLALLFVYFILGYLIFACIMTWSGMIGRTPQESGQMAALWMLTAASPLFFLANIGAAPNAPLARVLSFFPLSSPVTMMMRTAGPDVPIIDVVVSLVIDTATIYAAVRGGARIFRTAGLMYGKRPTLAELVRWVRAAA